MDPLIYSLMPATPGDRAQVESPRQLNLPSARSPEAWNALIRTFTEDQEPESDEQPETFERQF